MAGYTGSASVTMEHSMSVQITFWLDTQTPVDTSVDEFGHSWILSSNAAAKVWRCIKCNQIMVSDNDYPPEKDVKFYIGKTHNRSSSPGWLDCEEGVVWNIINS